MADLGPVEARLRAIVDAYRDRLVVGSVYGLETLTRSSAKAHDFFTFVKPGTSYVSLYLKPIYTWPDLLDDISPALRKRLQGTRTAFGFAAVDDELLAELEALVERAFRRYDKAGRTADAAAEAAVETAAEAAVAGAVARNSCSPRSRVSEPAVDRRRSAARPATRRRLVDPT